jgi:hypothetical protein
MRSLRWLADLCGVPPVDHFPSLASALMGDAKLADSTMTYLAWWIRHPSPGSQFETSIGHLKELPDATLVTALFKLGYDGLIYRHATEIAGHIFFQRHGTDLCGFSSSVSEPYRGGELWITFPFDFVAYAFQLADITRVRLGGGKHPITRGLVARLLPHAARLGWQVSRDGWIDFSAKKGTGQAG